MARVQPEIFIQPKFIDKHGPAYAVGDVRDGIRRLIMVDNYFEGRNRKMTADIKNAIAKTDEVEKAFGESLNRFLATEQRFIEQSRRASGSVRDAGDKLAQGLAKIEKAANFDRLERYVLLLERAAVAMSALAELEASGKLDKIATAIR